MHTCIHNNALSFKSFVLCCVVESTVADELIKKLKFADVDEAAKFSSTIRACLYYHPQAFKKPR